MTDHPVPGDEARELVRGAYDVHVHIGPDVVGRRIDDLSLARRFLEVGLAGFVLKSHYTSTAERASVVRAAVPGADVRGALALNRAVGGMNPLAVEIAGREGAHTVWMPTVDAENESIGRSEPGARREGSGVGPAPARPAGRGHPGRARAGGRLRRRGAARDGRGAGDDRPPRHDAGHRATCRPPRSSPWWTPPSTPG